MTIRQIAQSIPIRVPPAGRITSSNRVFLSVTSVELLLCVIIYISISYWKTPMIFKHPRFWAEEGPEYYRNCFGSSFSVCMSYTHAGSYLLFTNLIVYLSTKVNVFNAPFVTTYL